MRPAAIAATLAALVAVAGLTRAYAIADAEPTLLATGTVDRVVDGDTLVINGGKVRVRGLDTPETKKPGTPVQCGGPEATAFAKRELLGEPVRLVTDPGDLLDRYGRTVAEVWLLNGHSYAEDAARAGMGKAYLYDRKHPATNWQAIQAAQDAAQAAHLGMWACPVR